MSERLPAKILLVEKIKGLSNYSSSFYAPKLIREPQGIVSRGKAIGYYDADNIRPSDLRRMIINSKRNRIPCFTVKRYYTQKGSALGVVLKKLILARVPIIFRDDSGFVRPHVFLKHLAETTELREELVKSVLTSGVRLFLLTSLKKNQIDRLLGK